jgi:hypothetical protein
MELDSNKRARLEANRKYNIKRLKRPKINAVMDVPVNTIKQLEALAAADGSKKKAILMAIQERYLKVCVKEIREHDPEADYPLYIKELFDE